MLQLNCKKGRMWGWKSANLGSSPSAGLTPYRVLGATGTALGPCSGSVRQECQPASSWRSQWFQEPVLLWAPSYPLIGPCAPCVFVNRGSVLQEVKNISLDFAAVLLPCSVFINPACLLGGSFNAPLPAVSYLKVS